METSKDPSAITPTFNYPDQATPGSMRLDALFSKWISLINSPPVWEGTVALQFVVEEDGTVRMRDHRSILVTGDGAEEMRKLAAGQRREFSAEVRSFEPVGFNENSNRPIELKVSFSYGAKINRIGDSVDTEEGKSEEG